jgi:DNA modification methylase
VILGDDVTLYLGDCLEILPTLAAGSVDLTVTSPPYDNLRDYDKSVFLFEPIARELYRVTKQGGVVVWVVGDATDNGSETGTSFSQALYFKEIGFNIHDTMIYMKAGPSYPAQNKYYQVFEYMFVLSKGSPATFNPIKDRENRWYGQKWSKIRTRRERNGDLKTQIWYADEGEKLGTRFNIWQYQVGYGYQGDGYAHMHPASFPEELAEDHILSWSNPGDVILDPMMGSGTTCKMAVKHDRKTVGIERVSTYFDIAVKRIKEAQLQMRLPI